MSLHESCYESLKEMELAECSSAAINTSQKKKRTAGRTPHFTPQATPQVKEGPSLSLGLAHAKLKASIADYDIL